MPARYSHSAATMVSSLFNLRANIVANNGIGGHGDAVSSEGNGPIAGSGRHRIASLAINLDQRTAITELAACDLADVVGGGGLLAVHEDSTGTAVAATHYHAVQSRNTVIESWSHNGIAVLDILS